MCVACQAARSKWKVRTTLMLVGVTDLHVGQCENFMGLKRECSSQAVFLIVNTFKRYHYNDQAARWYSFDIKYYSFSRNGPIAHIDRMDRKCKWGLSEYKLRNVTRGLIYLYNYISSSLVFCFFISLFLFVCRLQKLCNFCICNPGKQKIKKTKW